MAPPGSQGGPPPASNASAHSASAPSASAFNAAGGLRPPTGVLQTPPLTYSIPAGYMATPQGQIPLGHVPFGSPSAGAYFSATSPGGSQGGATFVASTPLTARQSFSGQFGGASPVTGESASNRSTRFVATANLLNFDDPPEQRSPDSSCDSFYTARTHQNGETFSPSGGTPFTTEPPNAAFASPRPQGSGTPLQGGPTPQQGGPTPAAGIFSTPQGGQTPPGGHLPPNCEGPRGPEASGFCEGYSQTEQSRQSSGSVYLTPARALPKLPPFDSTNIRLWIQQVELSATSVGITDDRRMFNAIGGALPKAAANAVSDILFSKDPGHHSWGVLRQRLMEEFGRTKYQAVVDLLENTHRLPNEKPSQFLRRLQLANEGNIVGDEVLMRLLLQSLPVGMQQTLLIAGVKDSVTAAKSADEAHSFGVSFTQAAAAAQAIDPATSANGEMAEMLQLLKQLLVQNKSLSEVSRDSRSRSSAPGDERRRSRSRSLSCRNGKKPTPSRDSSKQRKGHCWYHRKFGKKANNCSDPPCTWWDEKGASKSREASSSPAGRSPSAKSDSSHSDDKLPKGNA